MSRSPLTPVISRDDGDSVTAIGRPPAGQYAGCMEQVSTWRRRHPLLVDGMLAALSTDLRVSEGGWALPAVMVLLYSLAAYRPRRVSLCGLLMCEAVVV